MDNVNNYHLTIIGGGLDFSSHLSVEACKVIRSARVVYYASCHSKVVRWLAELAKNALLIDIDRGQYKIGQYRPDMYQEMARIVVDDARNGEGVVLIEPGSAMVTDLVTPYTLRYAAQFDLNVRILPGISSIEMMFVFLGLDPSAGMQAILAQELVIRQIKLNPQLHTIIIQPGYYDTLWCFGWPKSGKNRFNELSKVLMTSYHQEQKMMLVRFPMYPGDRTHTFWFTLENLEFVTSIITPLHTLFIPSNGEIEKNEEFRKRIHSLDLSLQFMEIDPDDSPIQNKAIISNSDLAPLENQLPKYLLEQAEHFHQEWQNEYISRNITRTDGEGVK